MQFRDLSLQIFILFLQILFLDDFSLVFLLKDFNFALKRLN